MKILIIVCILLLLSVVSSYSAPLLSYPFSSASLGAPAVWGNSVYWETSSGFIADQQYGLITNDKFMVYAGLSHSNFYTYNLIRYESDLILKNQQTLSDKIDLLNGGNMSTALMPAQLIGLISPEHYSYLMGLTGICGALLIGLIWSRGF